MRQTSACFVQWRQKKPKQGIGFNFSGHAAATMVGSPIMSTRYPSTAIFFLCFDPVPFLALSVPSLPNSVMPWQVSPPSTIEQTRAPPSPLPPLLPPRPLLFLFPRCSQASCVQTAAAAAAARPHFCRSLRPVAWKKRLHHHRPIGTNDRRLSCLSLRQIFGSTSAAMKLTLTKTLGFQPLHFLRYSVFLTRRLLRRASPAPQIYHRLWSQLFRLLSPIKRSRLVGCT